MVTMTLYVRQQKRHRDKEQTVGLCGRRRGWDDFRELEQIISQFVWKYKKPRIAKAILGKKNGPGGINLPDFSFFGTVV